MYSSYNLDARLKMCALFSGNMMIVFRESVLVLVVLPIPVLRVCDDHQKGSTGHGHENVQVAFANPSPSLPGLEVFSEWLISTEPHRLGSGLVDMLTRLGFSHPSEANGSGEMRRDCVAG